MDYDRRNSPPVGYRPIKKYEIMKKIKTSKKLEAYIHDVSGIYPGIIPIENHGISFLLNGSIKKNWSQLQKSKQSQVGWG